MSVRERVRHARVYLGLSQGQLAELVGVSQPAISQIEKTGQVSDETLAAIARATGFAPWWFHLGPLPDLPTGSLRFRKRASSRLKDDERVRTHVLQAFEVFERLSVEANLPHVRVRPVAAGDNVTPDSIEDLAAVARDWLGVGPLDPIPSLTRAVERAGVVVLGSVPEIERHDAVSFWRTETEHPLICFTRGFPGDRQRFSIGHELGHLVLHHLRQVESKQAEQEAHRFSGALLFPREAALDEIETPVTLSSLAYVKAKWGIAISALIRRCLDLGLINVERRLSLEKQLSARGWRKSEPVEVPEETPVLMAKLIQAVRGDAGSPRLHEALGLPRMATRDLVA